MKIAAIVIALGLCARVAAAQPSAEAKAQAKQAFARAESAERRKDWRSAIDEYQRAYDLVPHPDVLFNIAVDLERLEEYRDAATYYRRYLDDQGDDAADRTKIEALIGKLRGRPGTVTVTSTPAGAAIAVDGTPAGQTPAELTLAGAHTLTIAGVEQRIERSVTVEFGEPQAVEVALAAHAGSLVVRSNVDGAQVTIDDAPAGTTPLETSLAPGTHRVVVTAAGWSSYQRQVDVHGEGTTQMTANLARPLGYTPAVEATEPRGYLAVTGGADVRGAGALYAVTFGGHWGRLDGGLGYGLSNQTASFVLELRVSLLRTPVRPYLRASAWLGSLSSVAGHVGLLWQMQVGASRARTSVFVDVGAGSARTSATTMDGESESALYVPVTAGVQLSY